MTPELEVTEAGLVQRIHGLRALLFNARLSTTTLAAVAAHTVQVRIPAGTVLAREGEPIATAYVMVEGEVTGSRAGKLLGTFAPRSVVGMLSILARDTRGFDYVATRDCIAIAVRAEDLLEMLEDHFELMHAAMRALSADAIALRSELGPDAGFENEVQPGAVCPADELDLIERLLYLRKTFGFHDSHIDALAEFARAAIEVRHPAGTHLWSVGDRSDSMLIVIGGVVQAQSADGKRFQFGPGDIVGSLDLVAETPRWFDLDVKHDMVALSLDGDLWVDLWEDQPDLGFDFLRLAATMLMSLRERVAKRNAPARA